MRDLSAEQEHSDDLVGQSDDSRGKNCGCYEILILEPRGVLARFSEKRRDIGLFAGDLRTVTDVLRRGGFDFHGGWFFDAEVIRANDVDELPTVHRGPLVIEFFQKWVVLSFDLRHGREHRAAVLVARGGASLDQIDLKVHLIPTSSLPA